MLEEIYTDYIESNRSKDVAAAEPIQNHTIFFFEQTNEIEKSHTIFLSAERNRRVYEAMDLTHIVSN